MSEPKPVVVQLMPASPPVDVVLRCIDSHGWQWPAHMTSGVVFFEGYAITRGRFLEVLRG